MQARSPFQILFQPFNTKNFVFFFLAAIPLLTICALVFINPTNLNSSDLMLIAWEPGRELLKTGSVHADYPYPLWTVVIMLPFTVWDRQVSMILWLICNVFMLAASLGLFLKILDWKVTPALLVLTISLSGLFLPVLTSLGLGQMTILSLLTLALMLYFFLNGRWTWMGVMIGLSFIKPQVMLLLAGLLLLWALLNRRWQTLLGFFAVVVTFVLISLPFISSPQQIIGGGIGSHLDSYILRTSNIWSLLLTLGLSWVVPFGLCVALAVWLGWIWLPVLRGEAASAERYIFLFSAAVIINLIVIPYSWMYNLVLLLLPFGYGLACALKLAGKARWAWQVLLFIVMQPFTIFIFIVFEGYSGTQAYQIIPAILLFLMTIYLEYKTPTVVT